MFGYLFFEFGERVVRYSLSEDQEQEVLFVVLHEQLAWVVTRVQRVQQVRTQQVQRLQRRTPQRHEPISDLSHRVRALEIVVRVAFTEVTVQEEVHRVLAHEQVREMRAGLLLLDHLHRILEGLQRLRQVLALFREEVDLQRTGVSGVGNGEFCQGGGV